MRAQPRAIALGGLAWVALAAACFIEPATPTGYRCDPEHPCPSPLACLEDRCTLAVPGPDAGTPDAGHRLVVPRLAAPAQIDAELSEFASMQPVALGASKAWVGWEPAGLVVAFEVADDQLVAAPHETDWSWNGDLVEVMVAAGITRSPTADNDDFHVLVGVDGLVTDTRGWSDHSWDSKAVARIDLLGATLPGPASGGHYRVELRLPWSELGLNPKAGLEFGLDLAVADKEGPEKPVSTDWAGLPRFDLPAHWGTATLGE